MGAVIGSPSLSPARARGVWRWFPRSGGALLASVAVHAAAAGAVGAGVVAFGTRGGQRPPDMVELDLAPAEPATNVSVPAAAPLVPRPAEPVRAHPSPRQRVAMRPTPVAPTPSFAPPRPTEEAAEAPRFVMSAGTVATRAAPLAGATTAVAGMSSRLSGSVDGSGMGTAGAFGEGDVSVPARLMAASPLVYPPAARAAGIELDFPVEIVVDPGGRVIFARALHRAGYGLDEAALHAIRDYRFSAALRAGRAVFVRMRWIVQFRLR